MSHVQTKKDDVKMNAYKLNKVANGIEDERPLRLGDTPQTVAQCITLLIDARTAKAAADKSIKACKVFAESCDMPIEHDGRHWEVGEVVSEQRCNLRLEELLGLLASAGVVPSALKRAEAELITRGIGSAKVIRRWEWR